MSKDLIELDDKSINRFIQMVRIQPDDIVCDIGYARLIPSPFNLPLLMLCEAAGMGEL